MNKFTLGGLIVLVIILLSWNALFGVKSPPATTLGDPSALPGIRATTLPWSPEIQNLKARLSAINFSALAHEGSALHIHQHLDLFIKGDHVPVPPGIGIHEQAGFISALHTHETNGVIHVESDKIQDFTLGQFFDVWGVRLTKDCIGGYCTSATSSLKLYVNGTPVTEDPRQLVLAPHQQITLMYGTAAEMPKIIPSSYSFAPGE